RGAPSTVQSDAGTVEDNEVQLEPQRSLTSRRWNRRAPTTSNRQQIDVHVNAVARERASQVHYQLERLAAGIVTAARLNPEYNANIDLFVQGNFGTLL